MRRAPTWKWAALAWCSAWALVTSGCRLGGGAGISDPWQQAATQGDAAVVAADGGGLSGAGAGATAGTGGASAATQADARAPLDTDAGAAPADDAGGEIAPSCSAPTVTVCNPVGNTGCAQGMQCDVDLAQPLLAGRCAFSSPMDAGQCFTSPFTESCPAGSTCDNGQCRTLCFCDTDCPQGECCHDTLGTLGFKLCKPCP